MQPIPSISMTPLQMASPATYTPISDVMDRHEYGINKNRKPASTGGGRAWSDDEEVYLLQTRLQKMPYKHIAAHLKKTELACRLHYHQLSHGSNRRKRTTSVSSGSSVGGHSPLLPASVPSPIHEHVHSQHNHAHAHAHSHSPTPSPPSSSGNYGPMSILGPSPSGSCSSGIQLPSIMSAAGNGDVNGGSGSMSSSSPRLPTILPKPLSMKLVLANGPSSCSSTPVSAVAMSSGRCTFSPSGTPIQPPHSAPLLPAANLTPSSSFAPASAIEPMHSSASSTSPSPPLGAPTLRLDCSSLPPPPLPSAGPHHPVDMGRLHSIYMSHRKAFWDTVASDYGSGASSIVLEQAWRSTYGLPGGGSSSGMGGNTSGSIGCSTGGSYLHHPQATTPLTPGTSPDDRDVFYGVKGTQDKTRISAILGIDANPRSPKEREMVRRLEEERVAVPAAA